MNNTDYSVIINGVKNEELSKKFEEHMKEPEPKRALLMPGSTVWVMIKNKAIQGIVAQIELTSFIVKDGSRTITKYELLDHRDVYVGVFEEKDVYESKEDLIKSIWE